jgi:hypothetical protein
VTVSPDGSPTHPSAGNALIGAAGLGARVMASAAIGATAVARAAARPAAAAIRGGLGTPPGRAVRGETYALLESLDAAGRRDIARARAEIDRALDRAVDRISTDVISSQRTTVALERMLESEDLWRIVDRIASSPEVLNAIASASAGLTGVVADEARRRTVTADEFAERIARRVLRRAPRAPQSLALEPAPEESGVPQP